MQAYRNSGIRTKDQRKGDKKKLEIWFLNKPCTQGKCNRHSDLFKAFRINNTYNNRPKSSLFKVEIHTLAAFNEKPSYWLTMEKIK